MVDQSKLTTREELETYRAAVADGFYQRHTGGLTGKYDNVRRYWEDQIKLQEKEWFASRRPDIANAPNAATRRRMIVALADESSRAFSAYTRLELS